MSMSESGFSVGTPRKYLCPWAEQPSNARSIDWVSNVRMSNVWVSNVRMSNDWVSNVKWQAQRRDECTMNEPGISVRMPCLKYLWQCIHLASHEWIRIQCPNTMFEVLKYSMSTYPMTLSMSESGFSERPNAMFKLKYLCPLTVLPHVMSESESELSVGTLYYKCVGSCHYRLRNLNCPDNMSWWKRKKNSIHAGNPSYSPTKKSTWR